MKFRKAILIVSLVVYGTIWLTSNTVAEAREVNNNDRYYTQAEVNALLGTYESRVADLEAKLDKVTLNLAGDRRLKRRVAKLEAKLDKVTADADNIYITGANLHIRNGNGHTDSTVNGLGNLIVGYNESDGNMHTGSHNLAVGRFLTYTGYGGLVTGYYNAITADYNSVTGGTYNEASASYATVSGGDGNEASVAGTPRSAGGGKTKPALTSPRSVGDMRIRPAINTPLLAEGKLVPLPLIKNG